MYEVNIADDHAVVCTGIQLCQNQNFNFQLIDYVRNSDELLDKIADRKYELIILIVMMPDKNALDVLNEILEIKPAMKIMVFTINCDENFAGRLLSQGTMAFVNMDSGSEQIIKTLENIISSSKVLSEDKQQLHYESDISHALSMKTHSNILTDREYQILKFIARGFKSEEIASSLSISKNTISNHRNNILKKLRLRNNSDLTRYAILQSVI